MSKLKSTVLAGVLVAHSVVSPSASPGRRLHRPHRHQHVGSVVLDEFLNNASGQ